MVCTGSIRDNVLQYQTFLYSYILNLVLSFPILLCTDSINKHFNIERFIYLFILNSVLTVPVLVFAFLIKDNVFQYQTFLYSFIPNLELTVLVLIYTYSIRDNVFQYQTFLYSFIPNPVLSIFPTLLCTNLISKLTLGLEINKWKIYK